MKLQIRLLCTLVCAAMLGGCVAPVNLALEAEKSQNDRILKTGIAALKKHIKDLQERGDPLGDYFYALANSDGWIEDVKDPVAITALFEKAATKGVMDAQILLALQEAGSEPVPGRLDYGQGPSEDLKAWESGLSKLLPLLQQQCYARRLVLTDGRPRVRYYSIAYKVWPEFRDGYYRRNPDGTRTLLKDPERLNLWRAIDKQCVVPESDFLDIQRKER